MTIIFADDFETGDLSQETGTLQTNGTVSVVNTTKHHGTYSLKAEVTSAGANGALVYKDLGTSGYGTLFIRAYVYLVDLVTIDGYVARLLAFKDTTNNDVAMLGIKRVSGTTKWYLNYYNGGAYSELTIDSPLPQTSMWYCLELEIATGTSGECRGWIDGTEQFTVTNVNMGTNNLRYTRVGRASYRGWPTVAGAAYLDCTVVGDAYIGPEAALQTVMDSLSFSDAVLRDKTLSLFDSLELAEAFCCNKLLLLGDAASLSELVTVMITEVMKYVTDSVKIADMVIALKTLKASDTVVLVESVCTPSRVLQALEAIIIADNIFVNKVLQITETVSLVEVVQFGIGRTKKTTLFLILGDLAMQLTSN